MKGNTPKVQTHVRMSLNDGLGVYDILIGKSTFLAFIQMFGLEKMSNKTRLQNGTITEHVVRYSSPHSTPHPLLQASKGIELRPNLVATERSRNCTSARIEDGCPENKTRLQSPTGPSYLRTCMPLPMLIFAVNPVT